MGVKNNKTLENSHIEGLSNVAIKWVYGCERFTVKFCSIL